MVELKDNNGGALSCIVMMLDSLAKSNNTAVTIETLHDSDCDIFGHLKESQLSNKDLSKIDPLSEQALGHLYSCNCNASIEAVFASKDGETLLVPFTLADVKKKHAWLNDNEHTRRVLNTAKEHGPGSPLIEKEFGVMATEFQNRKGISGVPEKEITDEPIEFSPDATIN
jgi:hypothetical protein